MIFNNVYFSWNPFKCGDCIDEMMGGCCCRPEHRNEGCQHITVPSNWDCSFGDYLIWSGVNSIDVKHQGLMVGMKITETPGKCRHECEINQDCQEGLEKSTIFSIKRSISYLIIKKVDMS